MISLVLTIFSFRRIANRLWARNGEDGGLCGGLFDRDGSVATNALRELVLPCFQYIDDRHLGELWGPVAKRSSSLDAANAAFFCRRHHFNPVGYFLHFGKCVPVPTQHLIFLGHLIDTTRQTFSKSSLRFERECYQVNLSLLMSWSAFRENGYP